MPGGSRSTAGAGPLSKRVPSAIKRPPEAELEDQGKRAKNKKRGDDRDDMETDTDKKTIEPGKSTFVCPALMIFDAGFSTS